VHFLRKAQALYKNRPLKELSPSFWAAEGISNSVEGPWFDSIMSGIEHPLGQCREKFLRRQKTDKWNPPGRLLYTTGNVSWAVRLFLGLLRESEPLGLQVNCVPEGEIKQLSSRDKLSLGDFRVAFGVSSRRQICNYEGRFATCSDITSPSI